MNDIVGSLMICMALLYIVCAGGC